MLSILRHSVTQIDSAFLDFFHGLLRLTAQIEGLSWYFVTTAATAPWMHDGMGLLLWVGFFLNMAMVFGGFVRGLEGSMLLALRLVQRYRRE